jgi:hypothetical protein
VATDAVPLGPIDRRGEVRELQPEVSQLDLLVRPDQWAQLNEAIGAGQSVLVTGEVGLVGELPQALVCHWRAGQVGQSGRSVVLATYKGSGKKFFEAIAEQLGIPTMEDRLGRDGEVVGEKPMTLDALKDEVLANVGEGVLMVLPEAKRLTTGIRYWLEDAIGAGVVVVCFAVVSPGRDIFLDMLELELEPPSELEIRGVMEREARRQGVELGRSRLAALQPLAGRNPMLARKVVRNERLGLNRRADPQHTQYIVIMPLLLATLFGFAVLRFVGMGTGNKGLYITGGICLVVAMALKQLGQVRGARKRLGQ